MAFLVIGGTWAGSWIDEWLNTAPGFLLLGACGGMAAGIWLLVKSFSELPETDDDDDSDAA